MRVKLALTIVGSLVQVLAASVGRNGLDSAVLRSGASEGRRSGGLLERSRPHSLEWLRGRGGAVKASENKKKKVTLEIVRPGMAKRQSKAQWVKEKYKGVPLATRTYLTLILGVTVLSMTLIDPALLILDPVQTVLGLQMWRPITAAAFLGPPSLSWLSNVYYLVQHGQSLERTEGTAQQFIFLLFQVMTLSILHGLIGLPVTATALSSANLHCCGRLDPNRETNWLLSIKVKFWMLPACYAITDVLSTQSPMAAIPHITGVLSGHLYFFLTHIWPKLGGSRWLVPPQSWVKRLNKNSNDQLVFGKAAVGQQIFKPKKKGIKVLPKKKTVKA